MAGILGSLGAVLIGEGFAWPMARIMRRDLSRLMQDWADANYRKGLADGWDVAERWSERHYAERQGRNGER